MKILLALTIACTVWISGCSSSDGDGTLPEPAGDTAGVGDGAGDPAAETPEAPAEGTNPPGDTEAPEGETTPGSDVADDPAMPEAPPASGGSGDDASEPIASPAPSPPASADEGAAPGASPPPEPMPPGPRPPEPEEPVQSGTLTAGDYDDQLNPWLYQQYSNHYLQNVRPQENIPRLDLSKRIAVVVTDSNDNPYAGARIALLNSQGNTLNELVTPANGISYLYEDLDGLGAEFTLLVTDRLGDISINRTVSLGNIDQQRRIEFKLNTLRIANNELDLQLVIDTTGSMGDELRFLQVELIAILNNIQNANPQVSIRAGLVVYRDIGDQYVVRSYPFTENLTDMQSSLNSENFGGGGDYPEAMDQAMAEAMSFDWREQSAKLSVLVADAPPHSDRVNATWDSALSARSQQIHIVPVAASGVAEDAEYLMRSMAALTNSRYLFLTDDSGVGNSHAEPEIDCYIVTRLDGLLERVTNQVITGIRTEPSDNEIIREVGKYDAGVCQPDQQ